MRVGESPRRLAATIAAWSAGGGGTSTVVVDRSGRVVEDYLSLGGTIRNCAGGPTPWNSWITCEENVTTPSSDARATRRHGYNFEVPSQLGEAVDPIPLVAMGRMNHEAVSVDPQSGYVYETEDRGDSAYYRFVPKKQPNGFGDLQQGGDLYAMVVKPGQRSTCTGEPLPTHVHTPDGMDVELQSEALCGEIAENNGSNCTRAEGRCAYRKVGVAEMRRDSVDGQGRPVPLVDGGTSLRGSSTACRAGGTWAARPCASWSRPPRSNCP